MKRYKTMKSRMFCQNIGRLNCKKKVDMIIFWQDDRKIYEHYYCSECGKKFWNEIKLLTKHVGKTSFCSFHFKRPDND